LSALAVCTLVLAVLCVVDAPHLHSFPARRSSELRAWAPAEHMYTEDWPVGILGLGVIGSKIAAGLASMGYPVRGWSRRQRHFDGDRKSTRLNSSHVKISYAVFCLKKKKSLSTLCA